MTGVKHNLGKNLFFLFLASSFWLLASGFSPPASRNSTCQEQKIETLTVKLLQDLPSYANRVSQRVRRLSRKTDIYSYVLVAGRPEFDPLTLGPGVYQPAKPPSIEQPQQIFFTTLERQYVAGKPIELQQYHWLFLTQTESGWRLAMMFSSTGGYPAEKPPTPPRESSDGVIAQAVSTWLRDCQAGSVRMRSRNVEDSPQKPPPPPSQPPPPPPPSQPPPES